MARLKKIELSDAEGPVREILEGLNTKLGRVPNIFQGLANSQVALKSYMDLSGNLAASGLTPFEREAIALLVAQKNQCEYCLAAHTTIGAGAGIDAEEAVKIRKGQASDPKVRVLIQLASSILETKGSVSDEILCQARTAGYNDGQIAETVTTVVLNVYTNFFNHVNQTERDFPEAPEI